MQLNILALPAKTNPRSWEEEFRDLVARVSEIAILFVRFAIKHSLQINFLLHCLPKRILILVHSGSLKKNFRCNAFLPGEFPSIQSCFKNLDSPWKNHNKMFQKFTTFLRKNSQNAGVHWAEKHISAWFRHQWDHGLPQTRGYISNLYPPTS